MAIVDIPCVLGASYFFSKRFWNLIRGLEGLVVYGVDEAFMSLKAWMCGGRVRVATDVQVGHVFGRPTPFSFRSTRT